MDRDPWPSTYDRDLDVPGRVPTRPREPMRPNRRLVVNPLLAVSSGIAAILVLRAALRWRNLEVFLLSVGWLGASLLLIQCHCLDCGRTIWLRSRKRHACDPVLARWPGRRLGGWPLPDLGTQMMLWLILLSSISCLLVIFRLSH